ncbi:MAG: serine/threonine protein kinase [Planctomycetes bacterium]|nr:serine/threonine protein kinase [Planctomycetota bacterium]
MSLTGAQEGPQLGDEVLDLARNRLRLVAGLFAGIAALILLLCLVIYGVLVDSTPGHLSHFLAAQLTLFIISIAMAWVAGDRRWSSPRVMNLGMAYQLVGALTIAACAFYGELMFQPVMEYLSWLAVWILVFPLLIPAPPKRSLLLSLSCATTAPVVYLSWVLVEGQALAPSSVLANAFVPNYLVAALAVIPASLLYDLGAAVSAAGDQARRLGSYQLTELLGRGGMGEVWRAEHALLARPAAVKLIDPRRVADHDQEARSALSHFEREARATASLTSPHTVRLYDFGVSREGTFYYVMELLDGVHLDALVRRFGPLPPGRAVYLLRQLCESLAEAHAVGLVHRDVKPANVSVCRVGIRHDFVKVLDFGLVTAPGHSRIDPEGEIVGTPAFMAPEVARGETDIDQRADVYAIGCTAYWLLTGQLVFGGADLLQVLDDHKKTPPEPPSARTEAPVPPELERLVMECLAKDRASRPPDAMALWRRLTALELSDPWSEDRAQEWWREHAEEIAELRATERPEPGAEPNALLLWSGADGWANWLDHAGGSLGDPVSSGDDTQTCHPPQSTFRPHSEDQEAS